MGTGQVSKEWGLFKTIIYINLLSVYNIYFSISEIFIWDIQVFNCTWLFKCNYISKLLFYVCLRIPFI